MNPTRSQGDRLQEVLGRDIVVVPLSLAHDGRLRSLLQKIPGITLALANRPYGASVVVMRKLHGGSITVLRSILRTLCAGRRLNSGSRQRDARRSRARGNQKSSLTQHQTHLRRPPAVANRLRISTKEFRALEIPRHRRWFRLAEFPRQVAQLAKTEADVVFSQQLLNLSGPITRLNISS